MSDEWQETLAWTFRSFAAVVAVVLVIAALGLIHSVGTAKQGDRDAQRIDALETAAAASPTAGAER